MTIWQMFRDPFLKAAFARAGRDNGPAIPVPSPIRPAPRPGAAALERADA